MIWTKAKLWWYSLRKLIYLHLLVKKCKQFEDFFPWSGQIYKSQSKHLTKTIDFISYIAALYPSVLPGIARFLRALSAACCTVTFPSSTCLSSKSISFSTMPLSTIWIQFPSEEKKSIIFFLCTNIYKYFVMLMPTVIIYISENGTTGKSNSPWDL